MSWLLLALTACAPLAVPSQSTVTSPSTRPVLEEVPAPLRDFPRQDIEVSGTTWWVALADTPERRRQGLMRVRDLGGLDGMLFAFSEESTSGFWMKDTPIPLDVAFFDHDGRLVEVIQMEPCTAEPCPVYRPSSPYRWALEAPAGSLVRLPDDAALAVPGG